MALRGTVSQYTRHFQVFFSTGLVQKSVSPFKYFWPSMDMCEKLLEVGNRTFTKKIQANPWPSRDMYQKTPRSGKNSLKRFLSNRIPSPPLDVANRTSTRVFFHFNSASSHGRVRKRPQSGKLQLKNVCFSIGSHCPPMDMWEKHLEVANRTLKKGVFSPANPVLPKQRVFLHPNSMPSNAHVQKTPRSGQLQLKNVCFSIGRIVHNSECVSLN